MIRHQGVIKFKFSVNNFINSCNNIKNKGKK